MKTAAAVRSNIKRICKNTTYSVDQPILEEMNVNTTFRKSLLAVTLAAGGVFACGTASAQWACATPAGTFHMAVPAAYEGQPCGDGRIYGQSVFLRPLTGTVSNLSYYPPRSPGWATEQPPMGFPGQVAATLGANREWQTTAECAQQFGISHAAAACITTRLTVDEIQKCFQDGIGGRGCFGDNNTLVKLVRGNFAAATRESTAVGAVIRGTVGVSPDAIRKYGICGGKNSFARKLGCK